MLAKRLPHTSTEKGNCKGFGNVAWTDTVSAETQHLRGQIFMHLYREWRSKKKNPMRKSHHTYPYPHSHPHAHSPTQPHPHSHSHPHPPTPTPNTTPTPHTNIRTSTHIHTHTLSHTLICRLYISLFEIQSDFPYWLKGVLWVMLWI